MDDGYRLRWFQEGDLEAYLTGLRLDLYDVYDERIFNWKFVDNPFNLGFISIVVVEEEETGKPVGFNGFLPLEVRSGGDRFTIVQGCDGFIDSSHRRRGLFQRTIEYMSGILSELGPRILVGFNLPASSSAAIKMGSTLIGNVKKLTLKISEFEAFDSSENFVLAPCNLNDIHESYEQWAEDTLLLHISRSLKYLRWRFGGDPITSYDYRLLKVGEEIQGYIISSIITKEDSLHLYIYDYIMTDPEYAEEQLSKSIGVLISEYDDVDVVDVLSFNRHSFDATLTKIGFQFEPNPVFSIIMKSLDRKNSVERLKIKSVDISDIDAWHLRRSDIL